MHTNAHRVLFYAASDERDRPSLRVETRADSCAPLFSIKVYIKKRTGTEKSGELGGVRSTE
jgi:hypothetical protein